VCLVEFHGAGKIDQTSGVTRAVAMKIPEGAIPSRRGLARDAFQIQANVFEIFTIIGTAGVVVIAAAATTSVVVVVVVVVGVVVVIAATASVVVVTAAIGVGTARLVVGRGARSCLLHFLHLVAETSGEAGYQYAENQCAIANGSPIVHDGVLWLLYSERVEHSLLLQ
jgi:hypothetical protein